MGNIQQYTKYINAELNKPSVQCEGSSANNIHTCSWRCVDYTHKKIYCKCRCHKRIFSTKAQIRRREEKTTRRLLKLVASRQKSTGVLA
jgi:hypothetical protein